MTKTHDNTDAVKAFLAKKAEVDAMLNRLVKLSAEHFDTNPDTLHWGDVGSLGYYAEQIKRVTDMAFNEGDHAA